MAVPVQLQSSCDPECLGKHERCFLGNPPGFMHRNVQVARRCQQSLCIAEHFMNYFMRMKLAISVCCLSGDLELEGFFGFFVFVWVFFFCDDKQDSSLLVFLVATVE